MGSTTTGTLGDKAERFACAWLTRRGLRLVAQNFRCRGGEIDLVMLDEDCLTFVEVRYRRSSSFSAPAATVDARKQRKLLRTAAMFLGRHRKYANHTMRFDVLALAGNRAIDVQWIRDAFRPGNSSL